MREILARIVCLLTVALVLVLAHVFAAKHNPGTSVMVSAPAATPSQPATPAPPPEVVRGRELYVDQGCASCHSISGAGNPRNPLDGVGARRSRVELREWITGTGAATEQLAPAVARRKQRYTSLPPGELEALVAYVATLTTK